MSAESGRPDHRWSAVGLEFMQFTAKVGLKERETVSVERLSASANDTCIPNSAAAWPAVARNVFFTRDA